SVRDALSLLDQGIAFGNGEVREQSIRAMLGMIDDDFAWRLLDQVCAGQAAEALETVAAMALRSADFSTALDEILTALHNVSLYQVSPEAVEWKGVDAAEVSKLAGQADAELLQLLYQIALIGKRDLPLAPDPRSGFEMVLLRMIWFQPEHAGAHPQGEKHPAPAATGERRRVAQSRAKGDSPAAGSTPLAPAQPPAAGGNRGGADAAAEAHQPPPPSPPVSAESAAAEAIAETPITLEQLSQDRHWAACIERSSLTGLAREMMMNMLPESVAGDTLNLILDAAHAHLLHPGRVKKIEQHLAGQLAQPLKLQVAVQQSGAGAGDRETPSQRHSRAQQEKQRSAEEAFRNDPKVRELEALFDAEVVGDSIRPPAA
ncbi:MAG: hypothetical protein OXU96_06315, partial [Gammaproteobacteria bacterium]|nr:hypothetical protein [Gammaproteobacteria bacterium]